MFGLEVNKNFFDTAKMFMIILLFFGMGAYVILSSGLQNIKKEWPIYRCNPMMMPFASQFGFDAMENFTFCISKMQAGSMGFFLQPLHHMISSLGEIGGEMSSAVNSVRHVLTYIRQRAISVITSVLGIFMNIIIQIQTILIKIKDLVMKLLGVMVTILYIMQSSKSLGLSVWNGAPGVILRTLCFKDTTPLTLKSGKKVTIKNINLGDILINGSVVIGTLKLKGDVSNPYYKIWSKDLQEYIFVTGEHRILGDETQDDIFENYIKVSTYGNSVKTNTYDNELCCLITSDHRIQIGEYTFWDWED